MARRQATSTDYTDGQLVPLDRAAFARVSVARKLLREEGTHEKEALFPAGTCRYCGSVATSSETSICIECVRACRRLFPAAMAELGISDF